MWDSYRSLPRWCCCVSLFEYGIVSAIALISEQAPDRRGKLISLSVALNLLGSTFSGFTGPVDVYAFWRVGAGAGGGYRYGHGVCPADGLGARVGLTTLTAIGHRTTWLSAN